MPDPREVLGEISQRVHRMVTEDGLHSPPDRYITDDERMAGDRCIAHIAANLTALVAALTAVLDLHHPIQDQGGPVLCAECLDSSPTLSSLHPCSTVHLITKALEGGSS